MHVKQDRTCVACRNVQNQCDMIRIARFGGGFQIDENQKLGGRGAYICKNKSCIDLTVKKRMLNKSFKMNVSSEVYELLGEYGKNL